MPLAMLKLHIMNAVERTLVPFGGKTISPGLHLTVLTLAVIVLGLVAALHARAPVIGRWHGRATFHHGTPTT